MLNPLALSSILLYLGRSEKAKKGCDRVSKQSKKLSATDAYNHIPSDWAAATECMFKQLSKRMESISQDDRTCHDPELLP